MGEGGVIVKVTIYTYDSVCAVLKHPFDVSAINKAVVLDSQKAGPLGKEWGSVLNWSGGTGVYELLVDDTSRSPAYAPFHAGDLNANPGGRIDAIIYPLPTAPGGDSPRRSGPTSFGLIEPFIEEQSWENDEKEGVRRLVRTVVSGSRQDVPDEMAQKVERWARVLDRLGISPSLLRPAGTVEGSGSAAPRGIGA
jgi:hypothetical protein